MQITGGTALSKEDIDRMQRDAEAFAAEDHQRREAAEARNSADNLVYQVDKALGDYGDKVPAEEREAVTKANDEVKEALKGDDVGRIKASTEVLMQAFQRIGQAMYAQQQAATDGAAAATGTEDAAPGSGEGAADSAISPSLVAVLRKPMASSHRASVGLSGSRARSSSSGNGVGHSRHNSTSLRLTRMLSVCSRSRSRRLLGFMLSIAAITPSTSPYSTMS